MRFLSGKTRSNALAPALLLALVLASGCSRHDAAEEHRKLSLRLEHRPTERAVAGESTEIRARIQSSLDGPRIEAWVRVLGEDGDDERIPLEISGDGEARCTLEGKPRGTEIRYVIEARDAAGLVVALPHGADEGSAYHIRFEGRSSRILGGISLLSAILGTVLFLGAGAAGIQNVRGRMSAGPAGLLGGTGAGIVLLGLLILGALHAYQVTGRPWPGTPVVFSLSRSDLGIVTLLWIVNLVVGRNVLLDEDVGNAPRGERPFALAAVAGAVLTLLFLLF